MMSLWDALRMNMMISYQELVRTFPNNRNVEPDLLSHWLIDRGVPICSPYTQTIGQDRLPGWGQSITN